MGARRRHTQRTGLHARGNEVTAEDIMSFNAELETQCKTVWNCDSAIIPVTDLADWRGSDVLLEGALDAWGFVEEAIK